MSQTLLSELWQRYSSDPTIELRNQLILHYRKYVASVAQKVRKRLPPNCPLDCDDCTTEGLLGLVAALDTYDSTRGISFLTYATLRIRGAIFDAIRHSDTASRNWRLRLNRYEQVVSGFRVEHGREPTDVEVCELLNLSPAEYSRLQVREVDSRAFKSLSEFAPNKRIEYDRPAARSAITIDPKAVPADAAFQHREQLRELLRGLNKQERLLLIAYYWEEQSMLEIAESLGLSESRVSQLHKRVLIRLKKRFGILPEEFDEKQWRMRDTSRKTNSGRGRRRKRAA